ncbi:MAG TPA: cytochrome b/b6 domain-containing protein [Usitatibacter sp.]
MQNEETYVSIKVWDLPVRIFHWAIFLLLAFQLVSGKMGGSMMAWHAYSGYGMLVLVIFRVLWGFAGSTHARFASFLAGPAKTLRFARRLFSREAVPQVGHNPLGGWMVIALLASLALQAMSGLFANDGAEFAGPLAVTAGFDLSTALTHFHRWNLRVLLVLVGLHIAAVFFHLLVKREDLLGTMFTGMKRVPEAAVHERREGLRATPPRRVASRESAAAHFVSPWRALALFVLALVLVSFVVR